MPLPDDLNDWLTEIGGIMVLKRAAGATLSPIEQLVYEVWLLDTQIRNGGLLQYFGNCGAEQWHQCVSFAVANDLMSFGPFAKQVERLIAGTRNPYKTLIKRGRTGDQIYNQHSSSIVMELRAKYQLKHGNPLEQ